MNKSTLGNLSRLMIAIAAFTGCDNQDQTTIAESSHCTPLTGVFVNSLITSAGDGSSWATAFKTVQAAVDSASATGEKRIIIGSGTYRAANKNKPLVAIEGKENFKFFGGYNAGDACEEKRDISAKHAVFDGEKQTTPFALNNSKNIEISGVDIQNGWSQGADPQGGGMQILASEAITLSDLSFKDNLGDWSGGAIYVFDSIGFQISRSTFTNNDVKVNDGGGIVARTVNGVKIVDTTFSNNQKRALVLDDSKGIEVVNSKFTNNRDGAIRLESSTTASLTNVLFEDNGGYGLNRGGAIEAVDTEVTISKVIFSSNKAKIAAAIYLSGTSATISSSQFVKNVAKKGSMLHLTNRTQVIHNETTFDAPLLPKSVMGLATIFPPIV